MDKNLLLYQCPRCQSSGITRQYNFNASICTICGGCGFFFNVNTFILEPDLFPIFNRRRVLDDIQNVYYLTDTGKNKFLCSYSDFIRSSNIIPDKENFCPYSFYSMLNATALSPLQRCNVTTCLSHSFLNCEYYQKKEHCWNLYLNKERSSI